MPRASWKGFLRLSLISCPVYLSPATTRTKSIRLNQVWVARARPAEPVDMLTIVIVGSSQTRRVGDWLLTPRGYPAQVPAP